MDRMDQWMSIQVSDQPANWSVLGLGCAVHAALCPWRSSLVFKHAMDGHKAYCHQQNRVSVMCSL
jgi:hypothetical protein